MTYTIVWTNPAMMEYRGLRSQDRPGTARVSDAVRALATDPRPATSRQLGMTDFHRLRVGVYRALYRVNDEESAVLIEHVGRISGERTE